VCAECLDAPAPLAAEIFCKRCGTAFLSEARLDAEGVCGLCRTGVVQFDAAYSYGDYDGTLRGLIHLMKYDGVKVLAGGFGVWLAEAMPRNARFDAIVPVPLHWRRYFQRGFNQSELLARELGRRTGLPVRTEVLRRERGTGKQSLLADMERWANVKGAFAVRRGARVEGQRLVLIDDVLTTGATLNDCARALKEAGAAHVSTLTLARVDRRPPAQEELAVAAPTGKPHRGATA
jgi:ComF family protein